MSEFIIALSVMFVTAGVLLLIANQFGLPPVPFYLFAGLITGVFVGQPALIDLALWGIAFLVFVFGIRIDLSDIQTVLRDGEVAAFTQILVIAPLAFGVGFGFSSYFGFPDPIRNAIYFSAAATLSSTLVGARILEQEIRTNLVHGRLASAIHFFDDIVAIGVLLILSVEVLTDSQAITSSIGYGVLFLLAGLLIYRHGFPTLIRVAEGGDELVLMGSISILIVFIAAAEAVGISIVVGAFAAGIAVSSEGAESLGVRNGIESIKDFFSAIFFVTVGALVSVPSLEILVIATTLIILVVAINPIVHTIAFVIEGYDGRTAFLAGSSLNQVSELALVIAIQAWILGTIVESLFDAIVLAAAVTMILSTFANRYENAFYSAVLSDILGTRSRYTDEHSHVADDISNHVVIIGYGRQGRRIVTELETIETPYVVIENDPVLWDELRSKCQNYVFGDAMEAYPLELAGVDEASLVVSTVDHKPVSLSLLERELHADLILRAGSSREAKPLLDAGATFVAVPSVLAGDQLVENLERVLGDVDEAKSLEAEHLEFLKLIEWTGLERRLDRF